MKRPTLRAVLATLNNALLDADAVARDMLRHPRARELGPRLHRVNYREAHANVVAAVDLIEKLADQYEPAHGDPSGSGGAGPVG